MLTLLLGSCAVAKHLVLLQVPSLEQQRSRSGDLCVPVIPFQVQVVPYNLLALVYTLPCLAPQAVAAVQYGTALQGTACILRVVKAFVPDDVQHEHEVFSIPVHLSVVVAVPKTTITYCI